LKHKTVLRNLVPELRPQGQTAGARDTRSLVIGSPAMIDWLITEANLVDIRLGERVTDAVFRDGFWTVTTNQNTYTAQTVINAAGAWSDEVAEVFGVAPLGLTPLRRSAAILEIDTPVSADRCMVMNIGGYYYRYEDE